MSFWDKVKSGVSKAASEAEKQTTIAKLNIQLGDERTELRKKVIQLGEAALEQCRDGSLQNAALLAIYEEIKGQEAKIAEVESQIANAKENGAA
jgi:hypothetical protein